MTDATVTEPTKLWFLLDRSGSMSSLTEDVIGGFNAFIAEQAQEPGCVHLTLVQFDTQAPFEIIHNAARSKRSRHSPPTSTAHEGPPLCWTPSVTSSSTPTAVAKPDPGTINRRRTSWW